MMADNRSPPHSRLQLPASLCLPRTTCDFPFSQHLASSVQCRLLPASISPRGSSSALFSEPPRENRLSSPSSCVSFPFSANDASGTDITIANSHAHLSSFSPVSQTSPHLLHRSSSSHIVAVSSLFSTSASSCEVELDSPFSLPPTPPPSPAFDYPQSTPSLGAPVLNLPWSFNADSFSSSTPSIPSSPHSSRTSVATRCSTQQVNYAGADTKQIFQPAESPVAAMSPNASHTDHSASSNVSSLPSPTLRPPSSRESEPAGLLGTVKCKHTLHSPTASMYLVKTPTVSDQRFFQRSSSPSRSYQRQEMSTVTAAPSNSPTTKGPFITTVCNTSESHYGSVVHPCGFSSHVSRINTGKACHVSVSCQAAAISWARWRFARRREVSRAPLLLCMLILTSVAFGVALFLGVSGGWRQVWFFHLHKVMEQCGVRIYSKGAAYASVPPDPGLERLAVSSATVTVAEPPSSTRTPEKVAEKTLEQTLDTSKNNAEETFDSTNPRGGTDQKDEPVEQRIHAEKCRKYVSLSKVSRWDETKSETSNVPARSEQEVFIPVAADESGDFSFFAATHDFLTNGWGRLKHKSLLGAPAPTTLQVKEVSPAPPVEEAPATLPHSHSYIPERRPLEVASGAMTYHFLSRAFILARDWVTTVGGLDLRSLQVLPSSFLVLIALSVCCCLCCLLLSGSLVYKHLTNYYEPHLQRYVCRVCLIAPAFAMSSLAYFIHTLPRVASGSSERHTAARTSAIIPADATPTKYFFSYAAAEPGVIAAPDNNATYAGPDVLWSTLASASLARQEEVFVEFLRDLAQAVALYSFLVLMTNCCGGDRCISLTVACNPNKVSPVPPLNLFFSPFHPGPHILRYLRIGVMQCVLVVPLVGILSLVQAFSGDTYVLTRLHAAPILVPHEAAEVVSSPDPAFSRQIYRTTEGYTVPRLYMSSEDESVSVGLTREPALDPKTTHVAKNPGKNADQRTAAQHVSPDRSGGKSMLPVQMGLGTEVPWRSLLLLCSVTICMFSLLQFYICTESLLRPYKPLQKFISIKFLVFFQVWQKLAIHIFLNLSIIHVNDVLNPEDTADLYHNVMMGAWTVTVSISHILCFPLKDHLPEMPRKSDTLVQPGASLLQSLLDVFLAVDVLHDAREMALVQHPSLDRACSLLLDQSVEANQDGLLAACTSMPQSMLDPSPFHKRLQRPEEWSRFDVLSPEEYGDIQRTSHPTPAHAEHAVSEGAASKQEAVSSLRPHSFRRKAQSPCAQLHNFQRLFPAEERPQTCEFQISVDAANTGRRCFPKPREGRCFSSKTLDREQQQDAATRLAATAEPFVALTEPLFLSENSRNAVATSRGNQEEDSKQAASVRVVISPTAPEVSAASTNSPAQLSPLYYNVAGHTPQHLYPAQARSHALMASLGTPALLLPHSSLLADTPLHLRHVTPSSDCHTIRSPGLRFWGTGDITVGYTLSGSPLTVSERRNTRQLPPDASAAAAAAAAVAAATNRTPLSATAKAAAAARFVLTAGANSPFHDCPAAALAAALGDFDPARNFTSVAVAVAAREDSGDSEEGEEGGIQQMEGGRSVHSTQSSTLLSHPICAYTSSSSSSSTSFLTDSTTRCKASKYSRNGVENGNGSLEAGAKLTNGRSFTSDSERARPRRRSWSGSLCGSESRMQRTGSGNLASYPSRRNSLASSPQRAWDAETRKDEATMLCNPINHTVDAYQKREKCDIRIGTQRQQGVETRITTLFSWARQSWASRRLSMLSNAREALAWFGNNLRTVTYTPTCVSNSLNDGGPGRQASALHGTDSGVEACSADTNFACGWGVEEDESQEVLMQTLTQQQQVWASPPHRADLAERISKRIHKERHKNIQETAASKETAELRLVSSHLLEEEFSQAGSRERRGCRTAGIHEQQQKVVGVPTRQHEACGARQKQERRHSFQQEGVRNDLIIQRDENHKGTPTWRQTNRPIRVLSVDQKIEPDRALKQGDMFFVSGRERLEESHLQQTSESAHQHQRHLSNYVGDLSSGDPEQGEQQSSQSISEDNGVHLSHTAPAGAVDHDGKKCFSENEANRVYKGNLIEQPLRGEEGEMIFQEGRNGNTNRWHCQAPALTTNTLNIPAVEERVFHAKRNRRIRKAMRSRPGSNQGTRDEVEHLPTALIGRRGGLRHEGGLLDIETQRSQQILPSNRSVILEESHGSGISPEEPFGCHESFSPVAVEIEEEDEIVTQLPNCRLTGAKTSLSRPATHFSGCTTCTAAERQNYLRYSSNRTPDSLRLRRIGWSVETGEQEEGEELGD